MSSNRLGFVIVEYNQTGGLPEMTDGDVYHVLADACGRRDDLADETARVGRGERFEVAELVPLNEET